MYTISDIVAKDFKTLSSVRYAVTFDSTRYRLKGVLFYVKNSKLYSEALDGYRLSIGCVDCNSSNDGLFFLVHPSALVKVDSLLKAKSTVHICVLKPKNCVIFKVVTENKEGVVTEECVYADMMECYELLSYSKLVDIDSTLLLNISKKELIKTLKELSSDLDTTKAQLCTLKIRETYVDLVVGFKGSGNVKEGRVQCSCNGVLDIGLNLKYFIAMLNSLKIKEDVILLELQDEISAILHKKINKVDLLMPIRYT